MERTMSNQSAGTERPNQLRGTVGSQLRGSDQGSSTVSDGIRDATEQAKNVAAEAAETIKGDLKEYCNHQLRSGAKIGKHFASSLRVSASSLPPDASMLASAMRSAANQVDGYAAELGRQNIEQVAAGASAFIRRRPALIFGLTALAGFAAFRMFKSAQSAAPTQPMQSPSTTASPSIQPMQGPIQTTENSVQPTQGPSDRLHG